MCVCVLNMCSHVHIQVHMTCVSFCGGQRTMLGVFLYQLQLYALLIGSLTDPWPHFKFHWFVSKPRDPPVFTPTSTGAEVIGAQSYVWRFPWVLEVWTRVLMLMQPTLLYTEPPPQPAFAIFTMWVLEK